MEEVEKSENHLDISGIGRDSRRRDAWTRSSLRRHRVSWWTGGQACPVTIGSWQGRPDDQWSRTGSGEDERQKKSGPTSMKEKWSSGSLERSLWTRSDSFDVKDAVGQNVRTSIFSSFRNRSKRGGTVHLGPKQKVLCPDRRRPSEVENEQYGGSQARHTGHHLWSDLEKHKGK